VRPRRTPATLTTRLSDEAIERLGVIAFSKGLTKSELAREVLTAYLAETTGEETL